MRYLLIAAAVVCLCAASVCAQSISSPSYPKWEIFGGPSANGYFKKDEADAVKNGFFSPIFSNDAGGVKGFEASIARNLNKYLGIKGDFSAYFDSGPVSGTKSNRLAPDSEGNVACNNDCTGGGSPSRLLEAA